MKQPNQFDKRILLAVSGMSPQIVTETLYAIAVNDDEHAAFIPTEIHLITTTTGKQQAELQLLHPETGQFHKLCKDYRLSGISFTAGYIHVIEDSQGTPLGDIKSPKQNEAAADFITQLVSGFTRDENTALHVSIAGGRKTMGYYLGYALSLYGRVQDRLSHVLVTEKYESLKDFFYPTPQSYVIHDRENNALDAKEAKVMLANIPFVPLMSGIQENLLTRKMGFNECVSLASKLQAGPLLEVDFNQKRLYAKGVQVQMDEIDFMFYLWMVQKTVISNQIIHRKLKSNVNNFFAFYAEHGQEMKLNDRTVKILSDENNVPKWVSERVSAVKKSFKIAIGNEPAKQYAIHKSGEWGKAIYSVPLTSDQILFLPHQSQK